MPVIRERRFLRVKLDMVMRCQLRCTMCHFAHPDFVEQPFVMDRNLLDKVAHEVFPRAHDVVLSSSAEPLMAPELPYALELCRKYEVPNFHFSTNALSMSDKIMDTIIDVQMPLLTVSCDSPEKETWEQIRRPGKWDVFVKKLDLINARKQARGSHFPELSMTAVLMRSNIRQMPDLVRFAHSKGVKYMNFVYMAVIGGLGNEHENLMNEPKLANQYMRATRQVADELGIQTVIPMPIPESMEENQLVTDASRSDQGGGQAIAGPSELAEGSFSTDDYINHKNREFLLKAKQKTEHNRACYFPWYYIHINPTGTVFPCGCWFEFTTFGDFTTQTFAEIWTGPKYKELRRQIYNMQLRDVCANCSVANMGRPDVKASFSHRAKVRREGTASDKGSSAAKVC